MGNTVEKHKTSSLFDHFNDDDWNEIYKKVTYYAYKYSERSVYGRGLDLTSLVQEAISNILLGTISTPPIDNETGKVNKRDVISILCMRVRKLAFDEMKRSKKIIPLKLDSDDDEDLQETSERILCDSTSHEDISRRIEYEEVFRKMLELASGDEGLTRVIQLWVNDPSMKPREMAQRLEMDVRELYIIKKRLRLILKRVREGYNDVKQ